MGSSDYYKPGDWNAYCARCGRKRKASELRRQWQGYYVCPEEWEPRQPQDFVRGITEHPTPPWVQDPAPIFVGGYCTPSGMSCYSGLATAGCAIPHFVPKDFDPNSNPGGSFLGSDN